MSLLVHMPFLVEYWFQVMTTTCCLLSFMLMLKLSKKSQSNEKTTKNQPKSVLPADLKHITHRRERSNKDEFLKRTQEYYKFLDKRRPLRYMNPEPVSYDIKNVIKTAGTSPSGVFTEPWTYVVVSSAEMKQKIRAVVEREEKMIYERRMKKVCVMDLTPLKTFWVKKFLTDAPFLILVFKQVCSFKNDFARKENYFSDQSVNVSVGILLTIIHNAGLNTLIHTPLNCGPALRELLNHSRHEKFCYSMPARYPSDNDLDLKRKPLNEILIHV